MSLIFGNEPYQEVIDMPDHIKGVTSFRAKNGWFKPDTIVKIFGEQHTHRHRIPQTFEEQAAITRAFLNNELMKDPKNILIMEAPNYMSHNPSELGDTDSMLHLTARRMASLHPKRVFMTDPRLDGENKAFLPYRPNIVQKRNAIVFMKDKMRRTIKEFPELEKVIDQERASARFPELGYATPLLDGYFLDTIQSSRKTGANPIIYTGDGHRQNLAQILSKHPDFTFTGSGINSRRLKRRKSKNGVDIKIKNPGSLKAFGYSSKLPAKERKFALKRAVKEYGYPETMRKINAAYVLNKNKPVGGIFESDKNWLEKLR